MTLTGAEFERVLTTANVEWVGRVLASRSFRQKVASTLGVSYEEVKKRMFGALYTPKGWNGNLDLWSAMRRSWPVAFLVPNRGSSTFMPMCGDGGNDPGDEEPFTDETFRDAMECFRAQVSHDVTRRFLKHLEGTTIVFAEDAFFPRDPLTSA